MLSRVSNMHEICFPKEGKASFAVMAPAETKFSILSYQFPEGKSVVGMLVTDEPVGGEAVEFTVWLLKPGEPIELPDGAWMVGPCGNFHRGTALTVRIHHA